MTIRIRKQKDIIVYQDSLFYSAFPSILQRPSGELIVAFRRAPDRCIYGEQGNTHTDSNSHLVLLRSQDNGETWPEEPELIHAHAFGGSQDPCMTQLADGTILCPSYAWARVDDEALAALPATVLRHEGNFVFLGGYHLRSEDGGSSWTGPFVTPSVPGSVVTHPLGGPCPAFNRGNILPGTDDRLYWAVYAYPQLNPFRSEVYLMVSSDAGHSWEYAGPIAQDMAVSFNETALYETPQGDLVAFVRTENFDGHTVYARSTDRGKSFGPWQDSGWRGHPHYPLRLPDKRVLLVYGYRHEPGWGIQARVLNPECSNIETAEPIVLRDDGTGPDLGYPWATLTADGRILVVYYFHDDDGNRHIAGTFLVIDDA